MELNGTQRTEASREKIYAAPNDVDVLKQCILGCASIEKLSDSQMRATVTLKVEPVKASFKGMVTLSDLDPPNRLHDHWRRFGRTGWLRLKPTRSGRAGMVR